MDNAVLESIEQTVLNADAVEYLVERSVRIITERYERGPDRRRELEAEHRRIKRELANLLMLAASGEAPKSVLQEIKAREEQCERLEAEFAHIGAENNLGTADIRSLSATCRTWAGRFKDLIYSETPKAKQALSELLIGPIEFAPVIRLEDRYRTFTFSGAVDGSPLIDPLLRKWRPQGDSNPCRRRERAVS